jgi:CRISPR-associated endoribonuclease Cas6
MPHSLVLNLIPRSPIYPNFLTGRHYHALFLEIVSSVDQSLANRLHEQKTDKAFTLSPLQCSAGARGAGGREPGEMGARGRANGTPPLPNPPLTRSPHHPSQAAIQFHHDRPIPANTPCWWRITLLDDQLFGHLTQLWLHLNPQKAWHLGAADLVITSVFGTAQAEQPWANFATYAELYERASEQQTQVDLHFATPTNFRQGSVDTALPDRDRVFNSLLRKWNQYSGIAFSDAMIQQVFPNYFNIKTAIAPDSRSQFVGCVGEISFKIFGDVEATAIKQFNALADFALYAGVGRKTPMGMGMARRVFVRS